MKQLILILALLLPLSLFSVNSVFAQEKYPEGACKQIYAAIGIFLKLADHEWKKTKDEEKALLYSQAAANYSVVYETVCRK